MKYKKIIVYSHSGYNSQRGNWDEEFVHFISHNGCPDVTHVRFPFGKNSVSSIRLFFYNNNKHTVRESLVRFSQPEILSYIKDIIYSIWYGFRYCRHTDLFVGTSNILVCIGLFLRLIGLVDKVAYVVIDYTPMRFSHPFINALYYFFDKIACYHSDIVWPLHVKMLQGREQDGRIDLQRVHYREAPFGNTSLSFHDNAFCNYDKDTIVYFGAIVKNKGCELFVPMIQSLIKKGWINCRLKIIGSGDLEYLQEEIIAHGLEQSIYVLGRIESQDEVNRILLTCGIAIAPYYPSDQNSFSYYSDPGKVKVYLGCGLPVVITDVPPIAKTIVARGAGLITEYRADALADAIIQIQGDYDFFRNNAIRFGREFDWSILFKNILL